MLYNLGSGSLLARANGAVCVIVGFAIFVELRLVTDRQTDGHTMTAYTVLA